MEFSVLTSGSDGNCIFVRNERGGVLVELGIPVKRIENLLAQIGQVRMTVIAGLYTHSHKDHCKAADMVRGLWRIPVGHPSMDWAFDHAVEQMQSIGLHLIHWPIPHDVAGGCYGYRITDALSGDSIGIVMDCGTMTDETTLHLLGCHTLLVGVDYCEEMLSTADRPNFNKERIQSSTGHLSRQQFRDWLRDSWDGTARTIVCCHLSRETTTPDLVLDSCWQGINARPQLVPNDQDGLVVYVSEPMQPTPLMKVKA